MSCTTDTEIVGASVVFNYDHPNSSQGSHPLTVILTAVEVSSLYHVSQCTSPGTRKHCSPPNRMTARDQDSAVLD
jgi:hypothetical protein